MRRAVRAARVLHPFPSLLDAAVVAAIAGVAGAPLELVVILAAAMLALQLAIGAANDWADAAADTTAQPGKPIPAGLIGRRAAATLAIALTSVGLALAATAGPLALGTATAGLMAGLAYDLRLKETRWSWLPYVVGIPLLPVFAWAGATGGIPVPFLVLVPVAAAAGAALAIANAFADLERDLAAGVETVATVFGPDRARRAGAILMAVAAGATLVSAATLGGATPWLLATGAGAGLAAGGVALGWAGRGARRRAWELQAIGAGVMATGWIGAVVSAPPGG